MKFLCPLLAALVLCGTTFAQTVTTTNMDASGFVSTGTNVGVGYTDGGSWVNEAAGQEFFPEVSGTLDTISVTIDRFAGGEPLQVSVHTSNAGLPGTLLGSVLVPESEIGGFFDVPYTFDLSSQGIVLTAGEAYVVTFAVDTPLFQSVRYRALRTQTNSKSYGSPALFSRDGITWQHSFSPPEIGLIVTVLDPPPEPVEVAIDVKPDSDKNNVNLNGKNPKPIDVAVLSDADFDATTIDASTATLGDPVLTDPDTGSGIPIPASSHSLTDVDGDGDDDLLLVFDTGLMAAAGAIDANSTMLLLEATLSNGGMAYGLDAVSVNAKGSNGNGKGNGKSKK